MNYSHLTDAQRAQVAYLFCDDAFGTDPAQFEYELNGNTVTGRSRIAQNNDGAVHAKKRHNIQATLTVRELPASEETTNEIQSLQSEMARRVLARILQRQPVEA